MAFSSKDLMASILPLQLSDVTCPEHTIPPTGCADLVSACPDLVSAGFASAEPEGLALLQQQLRTALVQASA
jgi:hypothetical protein